MSFYDKHVFFCTNEKDNGKECCQQAGATEMWRFAKQYCKDEGLNANHNVRVSRSGCLGRCDEGPCLVIYPEGRWYSYQSQEEVVQILEAELVDEAPSVVEPLKLP